MPHATAAPPSPEAIRLLGKGPVASPYLVHAVGHGADDCLVSEVLVEPVKVDLPVDAVIGWGLRREGSGVGGTLLSGLGLGLCGAGADGC